MKAMRQGIAAIVAASIALAAGPGCTSKKQDDGTAPIVGDGALPKLVIRDDSKDVMLTYIDDRGDTHVVMSPAEVPAASRSMVRVIVTDREEGTIDPIYVVDLGKRSADGSYTAVTVKKRVFVAEVDRRRDAYLATIAPPPRVPGSGSGSASASKPPVPQVDPKSGLTVIIYGASWCVPCHDAADYIRGKGVAVIVKDIDESRGARTEMLDKLEKSGRRGGSIPVIDVRGQILVGFNPREVDRALSKAGTGTVL